MFYDQEILAAINRQTAAIENLTETIRRLLELQQEEVARPTSKATVLPSSFRQRANESIGRATLNRERKLKK